MKPRALIIGTMAIVLVVFVGSLCWAEGGIGQRQRQQHKRIAQGMRSGELTNQEFARLSREQYRVQRAKGRARADYRLTRRERRKIYGMQDRASRHIYQAKHNPKAYRDGRRHKPYRRPVHARHGYPYRKGHHNRYCSTTLGSYIRGVITQPDWLFAWSVGLD